MSLRRPSLARRLVITRRDTIEKDDLLAVLHSTVRELDAVTERLRLVVEEHEDQPEETERPTGESDHG